MKVTRNSYIGAVVLVAAEELKSQGLIAGGPLVDLEAAKALKAEGEARGYEPPSIEEMQGFLAALNERPATPTEGE